MRDGRLTFREFAVKLRIGWFLLAAMTIVAFVFGVWEILEQNFLKDTTPHTIHYLFITRGLVVALLLAGWAVWTIFYFRARFESELAVSEDRFRNIVENSADAIITISKDNHILSWNKGAENIFGWSSEEILGKPIGILIPETLLKSGELLCLAYGIQHAGFVKNYSTERIRKDGQIIPVHLTESVLHDSENQVIGRSQIIRDISEVKKIEHQMRQSERLVTLGHLAAGVAHEIGNPLTSISSLVQLMERRSKNAETKDQLARIRVNVERISKIVRELVDFTRPNLTQVSRVQVNDVVENAVGLLRYDERTQQVDIHLDLDKKLSQIKASPDKLHQVIVNLVINALDATRENGSKIWIRTANQNDEVCIMVKDDGMGMTNSVAEKIFEPFFTTKEVGKGTGLGLSVSHGIIKSMKGSITVMSEPEKGTTFTIRLPMEKT
ncbi:MAG: PAS domain S-box protein [Candidatus Marinimicrobia bacterium]|nr:PAS domain S-box protein [Candidatus Neomarinimicrobiota bacterium]